MNYHRHDIPKHLEDNFGFRDGQDLTILNLAMDAAQLRRDCPHLTPIHRHRLHAAMKDIAQLLEGGAQ